MTSAGHERLLARERPLFDGAEPAGSSIALMNVARLAVFTDEERWRRAVDRSLAFYLPRMRQRPMAMTEALLAVDFLAGPVREIVIALPSDGLPPHSSFHRVLAEVFCPRKALVTCTPNAPTRPTLEERIPWLRGKTQQNDQATAYVCTQGQYLPKPVYKKLRQTIEGREKFDPSIADAVAQGMKEWAMAHGASH